MGDANGTLSGVQKAAILLVALGPVSSAKVLQQLSEDEASRLAHAIAKLEYISPEQVESTLEEFQQRTASYQVYAHGGMEYAATMLTEAYGPTVAKELLDRLAKSMGKHGFHFDSFRKADPQQLAKLIQDEHPQTIALILSHLDPAQAASLLSSLPLDARMDVAVRMADLDQISPEVVRTIGTVIDHKLRNLGELSREACGGVLAVANVFNRLDQTACSQLMDAIEADRPQLFENIRRFMFVFKDLENLDATALSALMSRVERATLITALKGASAPLRQKFIATLSQRAASMLEEDLEALGPTKLKDVDAAQQEIITMARAMEKDGAISLKASSDEQYVY